MADILFSYTVQLVKILTIKRASNTNADTARRTIGIVTEDSIGQNANGRFTIIGAIHGLNTSALYSRNDTILGREWGIYRS